MEIMILAVLVVVAAVVAIVVAVRADAAEQARETESLRRLAAERAAAAAERAVNAANAEAAAEQANENAFYWLTKFYQEKERADATAKAAKVDAKQASIEAELKLFDLTVEWAAVVETERERVEAAEAALAAAKAEFFAAASLAEARGAALRWHQGRN